MKQECNEGKKYMFRNDTAGANDFASDTAHTVIEVDAHWWEYFSGYRLKQWQKELRKYMDRTGVSEKEICEYAGLVYSDAAVFYNRLPKKRETYIGVGMALGQPLDTINRWIRKYGKKRELYVKDITSDLVWIYLIGANAKDRESGRNYYRLFDQCADAVAQTYSNLWEDYIEHNEETAQVASELEKVSFDEQFEGLTSFVASHIDALKTAYAKPRRMLDQYVNMILERVASKDYNQKPTLSTLRGYLDDSMINYLSGDPETIHALKRKSDRHVLNFKHIPKGRRSHISLALALGMMQDEVDKYLDLMGFFPLDAVDQQEGILINMLHAWEEKHPLQRKLKRRVIDEDLSVEITEEEEKLAIREMLLLRQDLNDEYSRMKMSCPYIK